MAESSIVSITAHLVEGDPAPQLAIAATDEPGAGGARHRYEITGFDASANASFDGIPDLDAEGVTILFQNGPVGDKPNGVTIEALLAICAHRLECFQAGPFPSQYNATALSGIYNALLSLQKRTQDRIARGVEGQLKA